jgi:hypothetical protein
MKTPTLLEMLKSGVHFGHRTSKWHPNMAPFIFTTKQNVHIINLEETEKKLAEATAVVRDMAQRGKTILFIGTKRQAAPIVEKYAKACGCFSELLFGFFQVDDVNVLFCRKNKRRHVRVPFACTMPKVNAGLEHLKECWSLHLYPFGCRYLQLLSGPCVFAFRLPHAAGPHSLRKNLDIIVCPDIS